MKVVPAEESASTQAAAPAPVGQVLLARGGKGFRYTDQCPTAPPEEKGGRKWYEPGYDVSDWTGAMLPLGYKLGGQLPITTQVKPNGGDYYVVGSFTVPEGVQDKALTLFVSSDNAALVYINGQLADEDPADPRAAWVLWQAAAAAGQPKLAAEAKAAFEALSAEPGAKRRMDEFLAAAHGRYMPARRYRMAPPSTRPATRPAKSRSLK